MAPPIASERGQALLEALGALALATVALTFICVAATLVSAKIYINHWAYEGAVCALSRSSDCQLRIRQRLGDFPWTTVQQVNIHQERSEATTRVRVRIFQTWELSETASAVLPSSVFSP